MHKKKKLITGFLSAAVIACMLASSLTGHAVVSCGSSGDGYRCHSNQYHTLGDKVMSGGVGQYGKFRRYYWSTGFDNTHKGYIAHAVSKWVNTTGTGTPGVYTSISVRETTTQKDAMFEFVRGDGLGEGHYGKTIFFKYSREIPVNNNGTLSEDYGWAQCRINVFAMNMNNCNSSTRESTIAHEFGHALGLSHQNCRASSIMCQTGYGRAATRADATDLRAVNHLYG